MADGVIAGLVAFGREAGKLTLRQLRFNRGAAAFTRYERTGNLAHLEISMAAFRKAIEKTPSDDPDRGVLMTSLAAALTRRYEATGDLFDLDEAIELQRLAAGATQIDHFHYPMVMSNLGGALQIRFERGGDEADLAEAIDYSRRAVDATGPDDQLHCRYLSNLGLTLSANFEVTGERGALDEAVELSCRAVDVTPTGHPDWGAHLSNASAALALRYDLAGELADLDEATVLARRSVEDVPTSHPSRGHWLHNLSVLLGDRATRHDLLGYSEDAIIDMDESIRSSRLAVDSLPTEHPMRPMFLSGLGNSLAARFELTQDLQDLADAADVLREAVALTPEDHPDRAVCMHNLSSVLVTGVLDGEGVPADLDQAIDLARQAVAHIPVDHPLRAMTLTGLGDRLHHRFNAAGDPSDLHDALSCFDSAAQCEASPPNVRLAAAACRGNLAAINGRHADALNSFMAAIALLPKVAWHGMHWASREQRIADRPGIAADAAACALTLNRPDLAVELLERGRGVLWSQILHLRADLTSLIAAAPDLAEQLISASALLDRPPEQESGGQQHRYARTEAARLWDDAVERVRSEVDGFADFLTAPPFDRLRQAAAAGPVVIVNISQHRCDAVIVTSTEPPDIVPLPITAGDVWKRATAFFKAHDSTSALGSHEERRHATVDTLDWLQNRIVARVLDRLPTTGRVWWCPTGPLSLLPLHASCPPRDKASDLVWSYTPTLAGLIRARQQPQATGAPSIVSVGMPETPGHPPLPAVTAETDQLRHLPGQHLVGLNATTTTVRKALTEHSFAHFACHASHDPFDTTATGLQLWDGPLRLIDIVGTRHDNAELAYLSACSTVAGTIERSDEAITLATAFHVAGYRQVIGTLWPVYDHAAREVARTVYGILYVNGELDADNAAIALHDAVEALRTTYPHDPTIWAPFVHVGT